jgi:hypothetical protein
MAFSLSFVIAVASAAPVDGAAILAALRARADVRAIHCTEVCVRRAGFRCVAVKRVC